MLREQDPCQSSDELHDDREGAFGNDLRLIEVPTLHLREQDYHLHRSCGVKVLALQEEGKATTNTISVASSIVRPGDQR